MCANGTDGISDIEGKVARVATSKLGKERVSISRRDWAPWRAGQSSRTDAATCEKDGRHPRSETRCIEEWKAVAASRPQSTQAFVTLLLQLHRKPLTMDQRRNVVLGLWPLGAGIDDVS